MISIHYGKPIIGGDFSDCVEDLAINWEISYEAAVNKCFEVLVNSLGTHNNGGSTFFDLLMCDCFRKKIAAPEIKFGTHGHGIKLPMMVFKDDWALHEPTGRRLPITNKMLNQFGEIFSAEFEIEYLGFERDGPSSAPIKQEPFISPVDMIYLLNNMPHVFDGKTFLPVVAE